MGEATPMSKATPSSRLLLSLLLSLEADGRGHAKLAAGDDEGERGGDDRSGASDGDHRHLRLCHRDVPPNQKGQPHRMLLVPISQKMRHFPLKRCQLNFELGI